MVEYYRIILNLNVIYLKKLGNVGSNGLILQSIKFMVIGIVVPMIGWLWKIRRIYWFDINLYKKKLYLQSFEIRQTTKITFSDDAYIVAL